MRTATLAEYALVCGANHAGLVTRYESGKGYFDSLSTIRGVPVASKYTHLKRGNVVSTTYLVNPKYLPEGGV